jgi:hypothetical protein
LGIEVVLGALITWAAGKARRLGKALDGVVDEMVDGAAARVNDKVREVVLGKLGRDAAVRKLELEVAESGEVSDRTRRRVADAVEAAAEDDPEFAAELEAAITEAKQHGSVATYGGRVVEGTAQAFSGGIAFGAVGGDVRLGYAQNPHRPGRA